MWLRCMAIASSQEGQVLITFLQTKHAHKHKTLFIGRSGWLDIRLFAALIRNTCSFFIISDKLEVLSELHNDGKISQGNTISA